MGKVMQIDEHAPAAVKEALDKKELSIHQGYQITKQVENLPEEQREDIFDLVHLKYRKHVERKKESIYWTYHNGSSATKSGPAEDAEAQGGTA